MSNPDDFDDPDAPASAEEIAASQRLRDALETPLETPARGSAASVSPHAEPAIELALSLRAAWDPTAISSDENRAVLDATPSAEEQKLANELREALDTRREPRTGDSSAVQLASALRAAFAPTAIDEGVHRAMIQAALAKMPAAAQERRSNVVRIVFGVVTGGLALAASIVFVVTSAPLHGPEAPLARARTTQPLFSEPFKPGETSARIDRIASARASDFRDNRFTKWGVR